MNSTTAAPVTSPEAISRKERWFRNGIDLFLQPSGTSSLLAAATDWLANLEGCRLALALTVPTGALRTPLIRAHAGTWSPNDPEALLHVLAQWLPEHQHPIPWSKYLPVPVAGIDAEGQASALDQLLIVPAFDSAEQGGFLCALGDAQMTVDASVLSSLCLVSHRLPQQFASAPDGSPSVEVQPSRRSPIAGIIHDINNVLGIITSYASAAEALLEAEHPVREDLHVILDAAVQGSRMLREAAKSEAANDTVQLPVMTDVVRVLRQVRELLGRILPASTPIELSTQRHIPLLTLQETSLKQAVLNLCLCLFETSKPAGGLTIDAGTAQLDSPTAARLHSGAHSGWYLFVDVRCVGARIPLEPLRHLLQPDLSAELKAHGNLARPLLSTMEIVRKLGGFLIGPDDQESIRLYLQLSGQEERRIPSVEFLVINPVAPREQAPTILLIDDQPQLRSIGERNLVRSGYQVLTASDGEIGVQLYRRFMGRIDLVICDLIMPGMDGWNTYHALRAIDPEVQVIFASGFVTEHSLEDFTSEGVAGFLAKPFTASELNRVVLSVLRKKENGTVTERRGV